MEARRPTLQRQFSRQSFGGGRVIHCLGPGSPIRNGVASPFRNHRGCWAEFGVLAASVVVGNILFRTARRDRLARRQFVRYDGTLDDLLESM